MASKLECFLITIKGTFKSIFIYGNFVISSGHKYLEVHDDIDKQILLCQNCNHVDLAFYDSKKEWIKKYYGKQK